MSCSICYKYTENKCSVCNRISYCDKICQEKDWKNHKLFCEKEIHYVFYKLLYYHKMRKCTICDYNQNHLSLSIPYHNLKQPYNNKKKLYKIWNTPESICGICNLVIDYNGPYIDLIISFYQDDFNINYYRCLDCEKLNYLMCPITFKNTIHCSNCYHCFKLNMKVFFISLYKMNYYDFIWLPPEILKLIIQTCILINENK